MSVVKTLSFGILEASVVASLSTAVDVFYRKEQLSSALLQFNFLPSAAAEYIADIVTEYILPQVVQASGSDAVAIRMYLKPIVSAATLYAIQMFLFKRTLSTEQMLQQVAASVAGAYVSAPLAMKFGLLPGAYVGGPGPY